MKSGSNQSLDWDSQADIDSPLKEIDLLETSFFDQELLPPALSKDRSESLSVNRPNFVDLGEEGLGLEPVCRNLNSSFDSYLKEGEPDLINQDTLLRRNLNLVDKATLERIREGDDIIGFWKVGKFGSEVILGAERLQVFGKVFRVARVVMLLSKSVGMVIT